MRTSLSCLLLWLTLHGLALPADQAARPDLPRVVLVGDSIRLGYAPTVEKELAGRAIVLSPKANGGDSGHVLKNLDDWVIRQQPDIVHFNCGIHDTKKSKTTGQFQVPPQQYEANLRKIVGRIRQETKATVLFATSTPILDERAAKARSKAEYELLDASIEQYNQIGCKLMEELQVPVDDLHAVLPDAKTRARLMTADGVHFVPEGSQLLGKAVAAMIAQHLPAEAGRPADPSKQIPSAGISVCTTVTLPHLFSDNMVIQRDMPVPVWGRAGKGEEVTVTLGPESRSARANDDGRWKTVLPPCKAGGPLEMIVKGSSGSTRIVKNVLVGEIWVCSGQSNMEKPIGIHPGQKPCPNYEQEIAGANYPEIRLLEVPPKRSAQPIEDPKVEWLVCSPQSIVVKRGGGHGFSACAYFFGRELYKELKVPIGLISANVSGTRCEPWTPSIDDGKHQPILYNGLIHPLAPYAIRGVIWYQGESNMGDGLSYYPKMRALIEGWRKAWGQGDFPFYFVQLPPYGAGPGLPLIREAQRATLAVPNTGMAVTIDIGSYPDCHCPNKQDVGKRLALWALAKDYGRKDLVHSGPLYHSMAIEGNKIRVHFDHVGSGLTTRDGAKELTCFEIAGADKRFVAATARIDGPSVLVSSPEVPHPVAVRLAWDDKSVPNLMNQEGLPATTFSSETP